jgi:primosomal protein N' (replication factor Y)
VIPSSLEGQVAIGQSVIVPFGSQYLHGLVTAVYDRLPLGAPAQGLKALRSLSTASPDHLLTSSQIDLSRWVADRYAAPWGQCIKLVAPFVDQVDRRPSRYRPTAQGMDNPSLPEGVGEVETQVLSRLRRRPKGITEASLVQGDKSRVMRALQILIRKGLVVRCDDAVVPRAAQAKKPPSPAAEQAVFPRLTVDDVPPPLEAVTWPDTVGRALSQDTYGSFLVQGARSTRLWCLVQAARAARRRGRRCVGCHGRRRECRSIGRSPGGSGRTAVAPAQWSFGKGTRSRMAIGTGFRGHAPGRHPHGGVCAIDRLGLVWVEGEDDASLKEEQSPRYHAREVARRRALCDQALLVLASGHPSLESWSAVQQGAMTACVYRDPAGAPRVQVIDLREYSRETPAGTLLSPPLYDGIQDALRQKALAILYLNRKGFASVLHCGDCGAMPQCDACSVALTFFRQSNHVRCHYCGRTKPVPDHCARCQSLKLEPVGSGTERIEEAVRRKFPLARVGRVDGETIRRPADARSFSRLLAADELDIVIGTQMLFRFGLQARAAFVGVPDADAGLHVPDFRSAERMYHGLVDAVELARPAHAGGVVMIQTRLTDHHAIVAVATGDHSVFLEQEQAFRQMLQYPPLTSLMRLDVTGTLEAAVAQAAGRWAALLRAEVMSLERRKAAAGSGLPLPERSTGLGGETSHIVILGPSPAPHAKARGRYCWQILVKSLSLEAGREIVVRTREVLDRESRRGGLRFDIDVDPVAMT